MLGKGRHDTFISNKRKTPEEFKAYCISVYITGKELIFRPFSWLYPSC